MCSPQVLSSLGNTKDTDVSFILPLGTLKTAKALEADGTAARADDYTSICLLSRLLTRSLFRLCQQRHSQTPGSTDVQHHL